MQRLSSPSTFFYKRVFPVFWFGFLGIFLLTSVGLGRAPQRVDVTPFLIGPAVMAVFGFVLMRKLVFDLVDEVWLEGDYLLIKSRGESSRIPLRDVINVNATSMTNPRRVTLMLRTESARWGKEITFMPNSPRGIFSAFKSDPVAADLIQRIDALRQRST
ncbi:hypothetical protein ISN76_17835 [Dyella halodurans]|uniref:PH domain-containing protein n=1 Tax=Dyella halodurans TaxID=1920171 RepID=A0ABV9C7T0_9GAMM|nr:hypothetical protein [Dyella halodurans]